MRPNSGEPHEVTLVKGPDVVAGLAWTANSESIVYTAPDGSLWRVQARGGVPEKLTFAHETQTPTIARAGHRLAYPEVNFHRDIFRIDLATPTEPARPPTRFISSTAGQLDARISPDGKRIVFESERSEHSEIWLCDQDGSNPVQITSLGMSETPRWSPDSRQIVFSSRASGIAELYVVNADGGPPRKLATGTPNAVTPFWSADGRWIYFSTETPEAVWKVASEGGTAVRLTKDRGYYPQESADGERIFYVVRGDRYHIWSLPINGGDERHEDGMPSLRPQLSAAWAPAQNGIYFIDGFRAQFSVNYFNSSTRHVNRVSELPGLGSVWGGIDASVNNETLLYAGVGHREADIMLVEGFHPAWSLQMLPRIPSFQPTRGQC